MTALAVQRHRCGTACWAAGCAIGGVPPPEPPKEPLRNRGETDVRHDIRNGGREITARPRKASWDRSQTHMRMLIAEAYDTVLRRYFWQVWGGSGGSGGRCAFSPWDRAVVWRRLETGESAAELAEHYGVETKTIQRILRRHEVAAGWRGKR